MRTLLVAGVLLLGGCDLLFTMPHVDLVAPADAAPDARFDPDSCPASYGLSLAVTRATSRYRAISQGRSWVQAASECAADQPGSTHLLVISSDDERRALVMMGTSMRLWIGLSDRAEEGMFRWVTGEPAPVPGPGYPWDADQPDDFGGNQDCVNIRIDSGRYDDSECDDLTLLAAVCECDGYPDDPSRYTPD